MLDSTGEEPWPDAIALAQRAISCAGLRRAEVDLLDLVVTIVGSVQGHAAALLRECPEIDRADLALFAGLCERADLSGQALWRSFSVFGPAGLRVRDELAHTLQEGSLVRQLAELLQEGAFATGPLGRADQLPELAS